MSATGPFLSTPPAASPSTRALPTPQETRDFSVLPRRDASPPDEVPEPRDAESLAGARIAFRQPATMITVPHVLLAAPLSPPSRTEVPGDAVEEWKRSAPARDFVGSIRRAIETLSCRDYPNVRMTAAFVGMSVRTLQRRLAEAGAGHDLLVAQARFATAAAVLEQTDAKILNLALDLGYSDHANFTRAFQRWAGCSPREYRLRAHAARRVVNPFAAEGKRRTRWLTGGRGTQVVRQVADDRWLSNSCPV